MSGFLKAPFPYFGGKSRAAKIIWSRFGAVSNYVEPFFGSGAVLLNRPQPFNGVETVNDLDGMLSNFWRATRFAPEKVAENADWPANECVPAGTMIETPDGGIPVEDIRPGMIVLGDQNGQVVPTQVVATKQSQADDFYGIGPLWLTGNHPVWTAEQGYVEARRIKSGLHVKFLRFRTESRYDLQRLHTPTPVAVYNFQTTIGNYFANGILVHNCDLHARHAWLVGQREDITRRLEGDPEWFDAKAAGWWVWGLCLWIGSGWCSGNGPWQVTKGAEGANQLVHLGDSGQGVYRKRVHLGNSGQGVYRQLVHLGDSGQGVYRQLVHLGDSGQGVYRKRTELIEYFAALSDRLRAVRVCCGDWQRVTGPSVTTKHGLTAIFLDPPYSTETRASNLYAKDNDVSVDVRRWAIENGEHPLFRICVAGYDDEHVFPESWECVSWKPRGGYDGQRKTGENNNREKERLWFSPQCLRQTLPLFAALERQEVAALHTTQAQKRTEGV